MATDVKMPAPAAYRYVSFGHSRRWVLAGAAVPPDAEPLYTVAQLEQYAEERVREALEALTAIAQMDPDGVRADDLGRAARIAEDALRALKKENGDAE